ncbi:hypothetical protein A6R68_14402 [Neotoma lepida]|uniref:Uncharacterized protein n=1 Tax=Neotoma lepida TaxID=56216 RepID=A0A1A6H923_NEOLE|nr:hypothetical protein A6R68_14402 [Neotoma lepida]
MRRNASLESLDKNQRKSKEVDKEQMMLNRQKGSPHQYQLRTSSPPDRLVPPCGVAKCSSHLAIGLGQHSHRQERVCS